MDALVLIGIGILIGWHVPIPPWATWAIKFVKAKVADFITKAKSE